MRHRVMHFISDPSFIKLQDLISAANFFKIVGRTHTERWHSAFWGWLLDKDGSHNLGDYIISKLFALLTRSDVFQSSIPDINSLIPFKELISCYTRPNEVDGSEVTVGSVGRVDIYIELILKNIENVAHNVSVIIEMKIDSKIDSRQCKKYANWQELYKSDFKKILIYFLPTETLNENSANTVGDERWYCVTYQSLHDHILLPVLEHPFLSSNGKLIIDQYIKNLRLTNKGVKMATTQEERILVNYIYENYQDVIETILSVLNSEDKINGYVPSSINGNGRSNGKICCKINDHLLEGKSGPDLLQKCLIYLVDNSKIEQMTLPWGTGRMRYVLTNIDPPRHPNGKDFFAPIEYKH